MESLYQRRSLLDFQLRIDEETLPEEFLFVVHAVAGEEGTVLERIV